MSGNAHKKFRSKWFRVCVEGATTDGRNIERNWIEEMARSYDRSVYGARVWVEHIRGLMPSGPFGAYGDIVALKAEEVDVSGEKRLALFAQVEPTDELVHLVNVLKQKIYTSIEITHKFAATGLAYLTGLGVTDSPASLGTEMMQFAQQHPDANPLRSRKQDPDNIFTAAVETQIEFEEIAEQPGVVANLMARLDALVQKLSREPAQAPPKDAPPASADEIGAVLGLIGQSIDGFAQRAEAIERTHADTARRLGEMESRYAALSQTPNPAQPPRPTATGVTTSAVTDC